jgi:regulator of nucleoside diphosphate kinase
MLKSELERARVVLAEEAPTDVVTMHSQVRVLDLETGEQSNYMLVFPADADVAAKRISVLAPLGTALLGFREGDTLEWMMPGGMRRLRIEQVHQTVADGSETPTAAVATGRMVVGVH